jgi:hypothetical protein
MKSTRNVSIIYAITKVGLLDIPPLQHANTFPPELIALLNSLVAVGNCGIKFCSGESDTSMQVNSKDAARAFVRNMLDSLLSKKHTMCVIPLDLSAWVSRQAEYGPKKTLGFEIDVNNAMTTEHGS